MAARRHQPARGRAGGRSRSAPAGDLRGGRQPAPVWYARDPLRRPQRGGGGRGPRRRPGRARPGRLRPHPRHRRGGAHRARPGGRAGPRPRAGLERARAHARPPSQLTAGGHRGWLDLDPFLGPGIDAARLHRGHGPGSDRGTPRRHVGPATPGTAFGGGPGPAPAAGGRRGRAGRGVGRGTARAPAAGGGRGPRLAFRRRRGRLGGGARDRPVGGAPARPAPL